MFRKLMCSMIFVLVLVVSSSTVSGAPPAPPSFATDPLFSNNAVLQRGINVPVWGTAPDGTLVTVNFRGQSPSTTAAGGKWMVVLSPMTASGPSNMVITGGSNNITLTGVQVGEVWVSSGQSNMAFKLSSSVGGAEAVADAGNHNLRFYCVGLYSGWAVSSPSTAGDFSAISFYFGRALTQSLNGVAVGLIGTAQGGTSIHEWTHAAGGSRDGKCYETHIVPLQPYAIRGVNWYQGENDAHFGPEGYYDKLVGLIGEWRSDWGQGEFPFQIGQLHWLSDGSLDWASVRDDQLRGYLTVANTGFATAVDLPTGGGHPPTKEPIGIRFALSARHLVHVENIVWTGPIRNTASSYVQGNQVVVAFDHVGGGLITDDGLAPAPFKIAGSDGVYYDASAQIVGNTVVATSASVANPVHVRYIWSYTQGNLFNAENLPAVPFQIDFSTAPDTTPPSPNPMTWAILPYATGSTSIAMTATTATDPSGVEYFFDCTTTGGHDSVWQAGTSYTDTGLSPGTTYTYRVQARDKSPNLNATGWSTSQSATTPTGGDTTPPSPNPMTWATVPYATGSTSIAMVATTATDPSGVEYYFDCTTTGGHDSVWQDSTSYTDTGLSPSTTYTYRVQARDKSTNQNATGWSTSQSATTQPAGGPVIFGDGFESGNFTTGGWTISGSTATVTTAAKYTGTYGAKLGKVSWIEKAVSTSGYTSIHVKYARKTVALDPGEEFTAQWYDGSSWYVLESTLDTSWAVKDWTLPTGANNNPNFRIKFTSSGMHPSGEYSYLDDVEVSGTQ